jgi:hypothetical protein
VRTRAELIDNLSVMQVKRMEHDDLFLVRSIFTDGEKPILWEEKYIMKKYWKYHDNNCKLTTQELKKRLTNETIWRASNETK